MKTPITHFIVGFIALTTAIFSINSQAMAEGEIEKAGILRQTVMTNFPWFIISIESIENQTIEKHSLSIEAVGLTSDEFIALKDNIVTFTMNPTHGAFLRDVKYNGTFLYQFDTFHPEWESSEGILDVDGKMVSLKTTEGDVIILQAVMPEKLSIANNQSVTAYYESWTDDNISKFGAAIK